MTSAIADGTLGESFNQTAFVREVVSFYKGILPSPTPPQYEAISREVLLFTRLKELKILGMLCSHAL